MPSIDPSEYATYFAGYIERVPDAPSISEQFREQLETLTAFFGGIPNDQRQHAYAPGKWTVQEVLAHLVDTERVMATRALYFARGATHVEQPDMDPDLFVSGGRGDGRSYESLLKEFRSIREANLQLVTGWGDEVLDRRGTMSGALMTVRAILHVMVGHPEHHRQVLVEKYGVAGS